eukprot:GHVS01014063.1.p1 GENE.GHVS01014063.1~~GHVS01014063.1.p1  ORF type:complete len:266 (+),score=-2.87 GHVS01014063.1:192-989(+)
MERVDYVILETFTQVNNNFEEIVGVDNLNKIPDILSNLTASGESVTSGCQFSGDASPFVMLSPMISVKIQCQVPQSPVSSNMRSIIETAIKRIDKDFMVSPSENTTCFLKKYKNDKLAEFTVNFWVPKSDSARRTHFGRIELMKKISDNATSDETRAVRLLMTVAKFARMTHDVGRYEAPDVALITLGYCLSKTVGGQWDQTIQKIASSVYYVKIDINLDCIVEPRAYIRKSVIRVYTPLAQVEVPFTFQRLLAYVYYVYLSRKN